MVNERPEIPSTPEDDPPEEPGVRCYATVARFAGATRSAKAFLRVLGGRLHGFRPRSRWMEPHVRWQRTACSAALLKGVPNFGHSRHLAPRARMNRRRRSSAELLLGVCLALLCRTGQASPNKRSRTVGLPCAACRRAPFGETAIQQRRSKQTKHLESAVDSL